MDSPIILSNQSLAQYDDDCACPEHAFKLFYETNPPQNLDNDCACPETAGPVEVSNEYTGKYTVTPTIHTQRLNSYFFLAASPYAPYGPSVLNQEALDRLAFFSDPQHLKLKLDYVLQEQALIQPHQYKYQPGSAKSETLTAWIHVTNACNLDCPYCYVRKSSAHMPKSIGIEAVERIFDTAHSHGFKNVKLKYAGGEATLHFSLIRILHDTAVILSQETDILLSEVVLSNGYHIRKEDAQWMKENEINLMVSLDGVGDVHDSVRPLKRGGKTFESIERTVDEVLLPLNISPQISMTLTAVNAAGAADVVKWALGRNLRVNLNFYRQNSLSASRKELELEEQALIEGMIEAYKVYEQFMPTESFFDGLLDRVQATAHTHTCGVQHNYLVIGHNGSLSQCQMHLSDPVTTSLPVDLLKSVENGPIQNISVDEKEGCKTCEFRYVCTGGCPIETFRATGRWDIQSPNCNIYKKLWPEALRLEGLRLLKVNGYL